MKSVAFLSAVGFAMLASTTEAACPNSCSGHGACGEFDACVCYPDWIGGDCSQRACPSNWAWVTTNANGDVNSDGDLNDLVIYDTDHYFTASGIPYIISQNEPGGTFESWPSYGNTASKDEGHFYMECSNQGICDRETGDCQCFDGYTGAGCRRSRCPNDCSGHGTCQTVAQQKGSNTYGLWDKDMSRFCVCDPQYSGPDCSDRKCPKGDDPLTTGQVNEKQWVDIYTDIDLGGASDRTFAGSFSLTYTDYNGKKWKTDDIAVIPYTTGMASSYTDAVRDALNGLPNNVLSGVTVTAGYAERVIPGNVQIATDAFTAASTAGTSRDLTGLVIRCPETTADKDTLMYSTDGSDMVAFDGTTAITSMTDIDDTTCYEVEHRWSVRFEISFDATPGDLTALEVDVSKVTIGGETNDQLGSTLITGAVLSNKQLGSHHATGGITASYTHPSGLGTTCSGTGGDGCGVNSGTKTVTITNAGANKLVVGMTVKITCDSTLLGSFTVASITAPAFVVTEEIPACSINSPANVVVEVQSWHLVTNADLTGLLSSGDILNIATFSGTTPKIKSVAYTDGVGHIFLQTEHVGDNTNDETITTAGTDLVQQQGDGTTESEECSSRGLCDRETGICGCFKGYTGQSCSIQNSLIIL